MDPAIGRIHCRVMSPVVGAGIVGRVDERDALERALLPLETDGSAIRIVIAAEPGYGKTTMVGDLRERAGAGGVLFIGARAPSVGGAVLPFAPVAAALAHHLDGLDPAEREALVEGLPSLSWVLDDAPAGGTRHDDAEVEQARVFRAVGLLLARMARGRPVLLAIDDLHWADGATVALISYLNAELASLPIGLVVAVRPGDLDHRPDVRRVISELLRGPFAHRIELGPLDDASVVQLAAPLLGGRPEPELAAALVARSGGVPLAAEALARDLASRGALRESPLGLTTDLAAMALPGYVTDLFRDRIQSLEAFERRVLLTVACSPRPATLEELARLAGTGEGNIADASGHLVRLRLAVADDTTPRPTLETAHPLVAEASLDEASGEDRRAVHASWASLLIERGARPREIAVHLLEADPDALGEQALDVLESAGREALDRGANDAAARFLNEAAVRSRASSGPARDRLGRILATQSVAWRNLGELRVAEACLREAARETAPDDPGLAATLTCHAAELVWIRGDRSDPDALLDEAAALSRRAGPLEALTVLALRATMTGRRYDLPALRRLVEEARETASGLEASPTSGAVLFNTSSMLALIEPRSLSDILDGLPGDWRLAPRELRRATFGTLLELTTMLGRWTELDALLLARTDPEATDLEMRSWRRATAEFDAAFSRGEWDRAADKCAELNPVPAERVVSRRRLHEAHLAIHRGETTAARSLIDQARRGNDTEDDSVSHLAYAAALEVLLAEVEGTPVADAAQDAAWARDHVAMANPLVYSAKGSWLIANARVDEVDDLLARLRRWDGTGGRLDAVALRIEALAAGTRDPGEGRDGLLAAAAAFDRLEMPFDGARARVDACDLHPLPGDAALLEPVIDELDRIGAEPWASRARKLAGTTRRSRAPRVVLTPREREVAALVAEGLSNAEIAERLFVSIRTVTSHLDHVYTKLGLSSRTALAAYVLRRAPDTHLDR